MTRAGQYLLEPTMFLGWFDFWGISSVILMAGMLLLIFQKYLSPLATTCTLPKFIYLLGISGFISVLITLILAASGSALFGWALSITGGTDRNASEQVSKKEQEEDKPKPTVPLQSGSGGIENARVFVPGYGPRIATANRGSWKDNPKISSNFGKPILRSRLAGKAGGVIAIGIILLILMLLIGGGYAFLDIDLGFWLNWGTMTLGIGFSEEIAKALIGIFISLYFFDLKKLHEFQFKKVILLCFGLAGLGFGAVEALKYFGSYSEEGAPVFAYFVRAVWCVPLHGSWTLLSGVIFLSRIEDAKKSNMAFDITACGKIEILFLIIPSVLCSSVIHGLYNTCCFDGNLFAMLVGGVSIAGAYFTILEFQKSPELIQDTAT